MQLEGPVSFDDQIFLEGYKVSHDTLNVENDRKSVLNVKTYWSSQQEELETYHLNFVFKNKKGEEIYSSLQPFSYGLYPTHAWKRSELVYNNHAIYIPKWYHDDINSVDVFVVSLDGSAYISTMGTVGRLIKNSESLGAVELFSNFEFDK